MHAAHPAGSALGMITRPCSAYADATGVAASAAGAASSAGAGFCKATSNPPPPPPPVGESHATVCAVRRHLVGKPEATEFISQRQSPLSQLYEPQRAEVAEKGRGGQPPLVRPLCLQHVRQFATARDELAHHVGSCRRRLAGSEPDGLRDVGLGCDGAAGCDPLRVVPRVEKLARLVVWWWCRSEAP